jgi:hypothetical protein
VLSGEIALEGPDGAQQAAAAGSVVGAWATLSGRPLARAARVVRDGVAMCIAREDLFDLLGERPALLPQLLMGVFSVAGSQTRRDVSPLVARRDHRVAARVREEASVH